MGKATGSIPVSRTMVYDSIIIGSGMAGLTAAVYAGRKKMNTLVLTKEIGEPFLAGYTVENYPGLPEISGGELMEKIKEQALKFGVLIKEECVISSIEKKNGTFLVRTIKGDNFETKTVIIAAGRMPKKLDVPGAKEFENRGVSFCTICDAPLFAGRDVAVIGGGNAALTSALDLISYANKVYVLQHREKFKGDELLQERLKKSGKVELINNAETCEIKGGKFVESLFYEDLITGEKKELAVGGIFISIGQIPNSNFAEGFLGLNERGEIVVDCRTAQSTVSGVFAAGDVADLPFKQYIIAAGEGAKAALSAHEYLSKLENRNQKLD